MTETVYRRCCGMDVHKKTVVVCVLAAFGQTGAVLRKTYGTFRNDLIRMRVWLKQLKVTEIKILVIAYSIVKNVTTYQDLGSDYFDRLHPERTTRRLVERLERCPCATAASICRAVRPASGWPRAKRG